jgi:hypothetical protein
MWLVVLSRLAGHGAGGRRQPSRTGRMSKPILQQPHLGTRCATEHPWPPP